MIAFLFFIFISFLHSNDIKPQNIEAGRRGDLYKVWVYFDKKDSRRSGYNASTANLARA